MVEFSLFHGNRQRQSQQNQLCKKGKTTANPVAFSKSDSIEKFGKQNMAREGLV